MSILFEGEGLRLGDPNSVAKDTDYGEHTGLCATKHDLYTLTLTDRGQDLLQIKVLLVGFCLIGIFYGHSRKFHLKTMEASMMVSGNQAGLRETNKQTCRVFFSFFTWLLLDLASIHDSVPQIMSFHNN